MIQYTYIYIYTYSLDQQTHGVSNIVIFSENLKPLSKGGCPSNTRGVDWSSIIGH